MRQRPLNAKERKALLERLAEQFGFRGELPYAIFEGGDDKFWVATRDVEQFLDPRLRIERIGVYVAQDVHGELRLSIEGSQLIGPACTTNVLELTASQRDEWMLGKDVPFPEDNSNRFCIVRHHDDYMGCGKLKGGMLQNYVPKERYVGATFPAAEQEHTD